MKTPTIPKTKAEIKRQIEGLTKMRKGMPRLNLFGDNNWDSIDAQIATLEGKKPFIANDAIYFDVERAEDWMAGKEKDDLFE